MKSILGALLLSCLICLLGCEPSKPKEQPVAVKEQLEGLEERRKSIIESTSITLADGFKIDLWATDSLAPDPIAMSIDDEGAVYLTRTNRQKNSEFDIRGYRHWMTSSISWQSIEDRRAFLKETFAPEKSEENDWLEDLNEDGIHDWNDLAVEQDEVWKITDENGDGIADISTRILSDFNTEITDVAGALLVRDEDVFIGVGPDMWRLVDSNDDGVLDEKTSISNGYAVHIGFSGHGMSGVVEGPDGKIYWGIGDIGANITAPDGTVHKYPNQGVLVRSNPDGSDFEVFARGLRNVHEFVFDKYGNIIGADNDGDHRGESERLVHIVEGMDAGWRANWQYGKYTDPLNNGYNVWMDEKMYVPRWEGQAEYIIPPLANYHNGPTGMVMNPGTALGTKWNDHFFLVEFAGNPARSNIWAFTLDPKGASFELKDEVSVVNGILPTGIRFGPDGALYAADWINGWGTKNYGRVWKLDVDGNSNDQQDIRSEVKTLMTIDYEDQSSERLYELLGHADMRIRLKAQFGLVTQEDLETLQRATDTDNDQLVRVHGIWGLGQLGAVELSNARRLAALLTDEDPEIVAQSAKVLGDLEFIQAEVPLIELTKHENDRVKFFATQALGRIKDKSSTAAIIEMIIDNNDEDLYLKHAGVVALSRIGDEAVLADLATHEERAARIAGLLALRRMGSTKVSQFLADPDEIIVAEAARAINDDWSIPSEFPKLASLLSEERFTSEPLIRRAINACLRTGNDEKLDLLIAYAGNERAPERLRKEAIATIGSWANPSLMDRVDGRYRGKIETNQTNLVAKVEVAFSQLFEDESTEIVLGAIEAIGQLGIESFGDELVDFVRKHEIASVRAKSLESLEKVGAGLLKDAARNALMDEDGAVRSVAIAMFDKLGFAANEIPDLVNVILSKGSVNEQQSLIGAIAGLEPASSTSVFSFLIDQFERGKLHPALELDLAEAIAETKSEELKGRFAAIQSSKGDEYAAVLEGGDARKGAQYFYRNPTGQCTRCHAVGEYGGDVGPNLQGIADRLSKNELLAALVNPSERIAPGYGSVSLILDNGQEVSGVLMEETDKELILKTSNAEPLEVAIARIEKRTNMPSSMPPMGTIMSKRELRDLLAFLTRQTEEDN
ncbi:MAG: HEAT repeat domain-containing protein [Cyclobacteriaceae bacterium]